jgi:LPXTG-motif cell wall-anchored protein
MDVETLDFHNRTNEEAPEESIPLAPVPSDPTDPSESDEEIEDEDVPLGSAPSDSTEAPKTGDNNVFMSMIIGALALIAMATLVLNKKKFFID